MTPGAEFGVWETTAPPPRTWPTLQGPLTADIAIIGAGYTGLATALHLAESGHRPVVLEAKVDPEVPPLPPHITLKQAKAFTSTLLSGDPREGSVIVQTAKELVSDWLPGRR